MNKKGLGKGLGALIISAENENSDADVRELKINDIEPSLDQPRKNFDNEKLIKLSESIKQYGIVQPIIVKREKDTYKIIAGERRWRAARIAGLETVPVIIKEATSKQVMEIALIENLQREDLNPIEEAQAYEKLMKEYGLTQEEVANTVGKSRPAVANSLRLLTLSEKIQAFVSNEDISSGHARALISIEDPELQMMAVNEIIQKNLNVRDTEKLVKKYLTKRKTREVKKDIECAAIEEKLKEIFGTKVKLVNGNKKGKIMIEYYSQDELNRILEMVETLAR
ncbi:MAG: ParB/RepB/Spo0J family partition protein [Clostridiales bacterium]|jgi:ParB family chromosome partitioning protein|nr:ParB/RepB/Spo0J family partition protein [Eubacteriales bacterium]MDH7567066.1 ParB/RepB/Spo0J family partition protein [Clostridiales bacterium]